MSNGNKKNSDAYRFMGIWIFFALIITAALIIAICAWCGVFNSSSNNQTMFAGGAGVGDFIQLFFSSSPVFFSPSYFNFIDHSNGISGNNNISNWVNPPTTNSTGGATTYAVITNGTAPNFFGSDALVVGTINNVSANGLVTSTNQGGPDFDEQTLIVAYGTTGINYISTFFVPQIFNFMQFKIHVGGWQWGWTQFDAAYIPSGTSQPIVPFDEQTVWPYVDYYELWNATGALGYTGSVVTEDNQTLIITNYNSSTGSQAYYTTNYVEDPHTGTAYLFTNPNNNLGLDLPDGFILYYQQTSASPFAKKYASMSYKKTNVVTTPTVPSVESGTVSFVKTVFNVDSNGLVYLLNSDDTSVSFTGALQPISESPWIGKGLSNDCPGIWFSQMVVDETQYTLIFVVTNSNWFAYGLIINPYTASPDPVSNLPYQYQYGSGSICAWSDSNPFL